MLSVRALVFSVVAVITTLGEAQWEYPTSWRKEDLEKLGTRCANVWEFQVKPNGKVRRDSTLAYCFCYDRDPSRFDAVDWNVQLTYKGDRDTLGIMDLHEEFTTDGKTSYYVERSSRPFVGPKDTMFEATARRSIYDDGLLVKQVEVTVRRTVQALEGHWSDWSDTSRWHIDSLLYEHDRLWKTISRRRYSQFLPIAVDTIFHVDPDALSREPRSLTLRDGQLVGTTTRRWENGRLVMELDSSFFNDPEIGLLGIPDMELRYRYEDTLLVEFVKVDWSSAYSTWDFGRIKKPELIGPPFEFGRKYEYEHGHLQRIVATTARGSWKRVTTTEYSEGLITRAVHQDPQGRSGRDVVVTYENGLPVSSSAGGPKNIYDANGLPLQVWGLEQRRDPRLYRFHYTNDRPAVLRNGNDMDWLKTYEPH